MARDLRVHADPGLPRRIKAQEQFVQFNDAIFKGKVLSSKTEYGIATTSFQVLEILKGDLGAQAAVVHPTPGPGKCGDVAFKPGQTVVTSPRFFVVV